jgi:hypothetical protein
MAKLYSTIYKSVLRAVNDLINEIQSTTGKFPDMEYWSWEDRFDEEIIPRVPLIGVNGFSFDENLGQWLIRFGLTISTVDDANLLDEADLIDVIFDVFGEKKKIALLDPVDGTQTNELVSVHCEVLPMAKTALRNYRSIGIELLRTGT